METPGDLAPPIFNYVAGFLLVGLAWGLTTPFIRRAARQHNPPAHAALAPEAVAKSPVKRTLLKAWFGVVDLLSDWRYAVPLVLNLTGSVWFFLLIGKAGEASVSPYFVWWSRRSGTQQGMRGRLTDCIELSLTVPITNSLAFLFTVLGEWYVERRVISRGTYGLTLDVIG